MVAELIPSTPSTTDDADTLIFGVYNRAARRRAALEGWETRRNGPTTWGRFLALQSHVADGPARLLCCSLAERLALPIFQATYPDDPRPALILWVARRYARGDATERERLGMRQVSIAMVRELDPAERHPWTAAGIALQAIGWCLGKPTGCMLWAVRDWLEELTGEPGRAALLAEVVAALEALPTRVRTITTKEGSN